LFFFCLKANDGLRFREFFETHSVQCVLRAFLSVEALVV